MVILAIGDVVGDPGMDILCRRLGRLQRQVGADLTVVNGENATGRGITPALAEDIFYAGADVITLGNHTFANRQICDYLDEQPHILRPLNFPAQQPGQGSVVAEVQGRRVCVANLQGRVGMDYNVSSSWIFTPRPPRKSWPWAITWRGGPPPSGAPTPMSPPPTSASSPGGRATSPTWA